MNTEKQPEQNIPTMKIETITPKMAEHYFGKNNNNRNFNQRTSNSYARMMKEGFWTLNGESIKFYENGDLADGQHRLKAIIDTGLNLTTYVMRGLSLDAQSTIDQQRKRTAGDILKMHGVANGNRLAAIVRMVNLWENGMRNLNGFKGAANFSPVEIVEFLDSEQGPLFIEACRITAPHALIIMAPPRVTGLLAFLTLRADLALADRFFAQLESGIDLHESDPVLTLRRYWTNLQMRGRSRDVGLYLMSGVRSWNAYAEGRKLSQISYKALDIPEISIPKSHPESEG